MSITFALQRPCACVNRSIIIMEITGTQAPVQWKMACLFGRHVMQQNAIHSFLTWQFFSFKIRRCDGMMCSLVWCCLLHKAVELKMLLVFFWIFLSERMIGYATSHLFSWDAFGIFLLLIYFFLWDGEDWFVEVEVKGWKKCLCKKRYVSTFQSITFLHSFKIENSRRDR